MEARAMNQAARTTMALGLTLTLAYAAQANAGGREQSIDRSNPCVARPVAMRTVMAYDDGAWTAPVAMILKSPADWAAWNKELVTAGLAIGEEQLPAGVDWSKEAVLVVALGEGRGSRVRLQNACRAGLRIELEVAASSNGSGQYPCHVVAMDRRLLKNVHLKNAASYGLSEQVQSYRTAAALASSGAGSEPRPMAISWGEMKDAYRQ